MRANKATALTFGMSRRKADEFIASGQVQGPGGQLTPGQDVLPGTKLSIGNDVRLVPTSVAPVVLLLNKPRGYTCSHAVQNDDKTIFDLLPSQYRTFFIAGRLDKDSTGLVILTNDGTLSQQLAHPSHGKTKIYMVMLDHILAPEHAERIMGPGVRLTDGISRMGMSGSEKRWQISLQQGRNRQIRRTFGALGYNVMNLHRTSLGAYTLEKVPEKGNYFVITE
jgi:23S rRNA pseudouridine2605 synthase